MRPEPRLIQLKRAEVKGVAQALIVDRNLRGPVDAADIAALDIAPVTGDVVIEDLGRADLCLCLNQPGLLPLLTRFDIRCVAERRVLEILL